MRVVSFSIAMLESMMLPYLLVMHVVGIHPAADPDRPQKFVDVIA